MPTNFIDAAMELAHYEIIDDDRSFWGEIPGFQGVCARDSTLVDCQKEMREPLSDWIAVRLRLGLPIPELQGRNLAERLVGILRETLSLRDFWCEPQ